MKSLFTSALIAAALSAISVSASLADPVRHAVPSHDSQACAPLQAMTKKFDGRYDRVDYTHCSDRAAMSPSGAPDPDRSLSE